MQTRRWGVRMAVAGTVALLGLTASAAVRAQDEPVVKTRIIIRTPEGEQEIDSTGLDGVHQMLSILFGPDGQILTSAGNSNLLGLLMGAGGPDVAGPDGKALFKGMSIVDPGRSYIPYLIKREDVLAHLYITPTQRAALEDFDKNQRTAMQQQMKASVLTIFDDLKGKSPEELHDRLAERARKAQEQMQSQADDRDKKLASILTPKQMTRLQELDRQWRGPLAMGVKDVAEQAKLTPEQMPAVADLLKTYHQEVSKQLSGGVGFSGLTQKPGSPVPPARSENPPPAATLQEMQAKMEQAFKEIEKTRKALGDKALNALSAEQRAQWSALTGKPFPFRADNG